jgi:hypothetical protein
VDYIPAPPNPRATDYPRRVAAWVPRLIEPALLRAVPSLHDRPRAAGRVAWATTQAIIRARGLDEEGPLSMSAVIGPDLLAGLLPKEDIAHLRALQLDIADAPAGPMLRRRLELLRVAGPTLPRHFIT